jgi:hypothetical protein
LIGRYQSGIAHLQGQQQAQAAPAIPALLLANIVAGKGEVAGRRTLQQLQRGMSEADAAAIVSTPAMQAAVEALRHFYKTLQVGATLSFHVVSSP